jgi:hypothetical protein
MAPSARLNHRWADCPHDPGLRITGGLGQFPGREVDNFLEQVAVA